MLSLVSRRNTDDTITAVESRTLSVDIYLKPAPHVRRTMKRLQASFVDPRDVNVGDVPADGG